MSDALTIARWCWPCCEWSEAPEIDGEASARRVVEFSSCKRDHPSSDWMLDGDDRDGVAVAELVLIERGLAEAYGRALGYALIIHSPSVHRCGKEKIVEWQSVDGDDFAVIATAPLDARVRAMAAVIRAHQKEQAAQP